MKILLMCCSLALAAIVANGEEAPVTGSSSRNGSMQYGAGGLPLLYVFQNGLGFGTPLEEAKLVLELGYGGVSQISGDPANVRKMVEAYGKEGLRVNSVYLDADGGLPDEGTMKALAGSGAMIELTVKKMSSSTVESVRKTCVVAESLGMKVALYPHHGYAVATMPQAMDLIEEVGHPRLGVMFNLCHFLKGEDEGDLEKVISDAGDRLFAVSVSGADAGGKDWAGLIKPLDEGNFPMERLIQTLGQVGFRGPVSLQCYGVEGNKKDNLKRSMEAWRSLVTQE